MTGQEREDPAAQAQAAIDAITAALAPLAEAYLHTMGHVADSMAEWGRQVGAALAAGHGARGGQGDPTGDGPVPGRFELPPSVTCPRCGRTSRHPDDIREGYCGACHDWTSAPTMAAGWEADDG